MIERAYRFISEHPRRILKLGVVITVAFIAAAVFRSSFHTDIYQFMDGRHLGGLEYARQRFGERPSLDVTLEARDGGSVLSLDSLREQNRLFAEIEKRWPVVADDLTAVLNRFVRDGVPGLGSQDEVNRLIVYLYQEDPYEFERFARKALSEPRLVDDLQEANILSSLSGQLLSGLKFDLPKIAATRATIAMKTDAAPEEVQRIFSEIRGYVKKASPLLTVRLYAVELVNEDIDRRIVRNAPLVIAAMLLLLAAVLRYMFKSWFYVVFPVAVLGTMIVWTFGLGALLGIRNFAFNHILVIPLLLGQCIDNLIHFNERFREESAGADKRQALKTVFSTAGKAAALTTFINMAAFTADVFTTSLVPVIQYAVLIITGLGLALLLTYSLGAAGLLAFKTAAVKPAEAAKEAGRPSAGKKLFDFIRRRRRAVLAAAGLLFIVMGINTLRISRNFEVSSFMAKSFPTYDAYRFGRGHFTLYNPHYALLRGDVARPAAETAVQALEKTLDGFEDVEHIHNRVNTESLTYLFSKYDRRSFSESWPDLFEGLAKSDVVVNPITGQTGAELFPKIVEKADGSYPATVVKFWPAQSDSAAIERVAAGLEETGRSFAADFDLSVSGEFLAFSRTMDAIVVSAAKATGITLAIIVLLLWLVFRRLRTSLIMIIPVVLGMAAGLGILPVLNVELNALNGTIGVLAVGLGIDYAIQIMSRYREELAKGLPPAGAMRECFGHLALPLGQCALLTTAGLVVLAGLLPITGKFGIAAGLSLLTAYAAAVTVMPIITVWADERSGRRRVRPLSGRV